VNLEYRPGKALNIGLMYDVTSGNSNMDITSSSDFISGFGIDSTLATDSRYRQAWDDHVANVYLDLKLDTSGGVFSIMGNLLAKNSDTPVDFTTENLRDGNTHTVRNTSDLSFRILSGRSDLSLPLLGHTVLETGGKYTDIRNDSDVGYLNRIGGVYRPDPAKSNRFDYHERNQAAYASMTREFGQKVSAKAGLRYERTRVDGWSPSSGETVRSAYGKLFPTAYLAYRPDGKNTLSASYSRRINRPSFRNLNPFRLYKDPYTYSTGNPQLRPSFSHNLELAYVLGGNLSLSLYHRKTEDGYTYVTELDGTVSRTTFQNFFTQYDYGMLSYYSFRHWNWWDAFALVEFAHSRAESKMPDFLEQRGSTFFFRLNNTFFLNRAKNLSFFSHYWQTLPHWNGNIRWEGAGNMTMGLNRWLLERTLQLSVSVDDIFRQNYTRSMAFFSGGQERFDGYQDARRANLRVSYTFGNKKVKSVNKDTKFDERGRAN